MSILSAGSGATMAQIILQRYFFDSDSLGNCAQRKANLFRAEIVGQSALVKPTQRGSVDRPGYVLQSCSSHSRTR